MPLDATAHRDDGSARNDHEAVTSSPSSIGDQVQPLTAQLRNVAVSTDDVAALRRALFVPSGGMQPFAQSLHRHFLLVPHDSCDDAMGTAATVHQGGYALPFESVSASTFLSSLVELNAAEDNFENPCDGGDVLMVPVPVQGFPLDVIAIVAAYIYQYSVDGVNPVASPNPQGGAKRRPTPLPRPFPSNETPYAGSKFERTVYAACDVDLTFCLRVMHAANYLGVMPLVELAGLSIAQRLRGQSPNAFRSIFNGIELHPTVGGC